MDDQPRSPSTFCQRDPRLSSRATLLNVNSRNFSACRVGPGNFTPSPSQIRTGYSRIIRLVPSREGCRLPLNEGLFPANRLAQINGDDLPPSLQPHYRAFIATTRQSAPLRRIGTFGLAVGAACAFPLTSPARFSRSVPEPGRGSRRLHAGCRSGSIRTSSELIPEAVPAPGFDIV